MEEKLKFVEGGVEIFDDLIDVVLVGDVVFFCGVGVLKGVGFLFFDEFILKIY